MQKKRGEWGVENGWDWEMCHTLASIPVPSCAERGSTALSRPRRTWCTRGCYPHFSACSPSEGQC